MKESHRLDIPLDKLRDRAGVTESIPARGTRG